ncbi:MAG: hypothetical protein ACTSQY_03235 [Candidatus Odinarchaeia archaeon]
MAINPLVELKRKRMNEILDAIKQAKPLADLKILRAECFKEFGMSPTLTDKYIKDLIDMGKVEMDVKDNIQRVKYIGGK